MSAAAVHAFVWTLPAGQVLQVEQTVSLIPVHAAAWNVPLLQVEQSVQTVSDVAPQAALAHCPVEHCVHGAQVPPRR